MVNKDQFKSTNNFSTGDKLKLLKKNKTQVALSRVKRRILKHTWAIRLGLLLSIAVILYLIIFSINFGLKNTTLGYYLELAKVFIFTPDEKIESIGEVSNILILGKGGGTHDAPDLTDTIIFASIDHNEKDIALVSLPRDIWIPELRAKLNSAYYWGNKKQPPIQKSSSSEESGGGLILAKSSVEKIVGQPIQYALVVDFGEFKKLIDEVEGIEVFVERSFVDEKYPIEGKENDNCGGDTEFKCRYETISFSEGKQVMDGEVALKFVRSRNAEGDEGTDFARAARQQKIIDALIHKTLSKELLFNPKKLQTLKSIALDSLETDLDTPAFMILARRFLQSRDTYKSYVLPEKFLVNPPISFTYDNLYVFIPKKEDWSEVHEWVRCVLESRSCE